jgi:acyl dehydratase
MAARLFLEDIRLDEPREFGDYLLTEDEIVEFARRWDPQPFHVDREAAAQSVFGELVACAAHLFAIVSLLVTHDDQPAALLAGLGGTGLRLRSPGRPGDRLHLRITYLTARPSASRPDAGVVGQRLELMDAAGRLVVVQEGAILVARRPLGAAGAAAR